MGNGEDGVRIVSGSGNVIGGLQPGQRNTICYNRQSGIKIEGSEASNNLIIGNQVGAPGNSVNGVFILGAPGNVIGLTGTNMMVVTNASPGNLISENQGTGVWIEGSTAIGNRVGGNEILSNGADGVFIWDGPENVIGGTTVETRNTISGNAGSGVSIGGDYATGNLVQGNFIGLDSSGTTIWGNGYDGVLITSPLNTVGGSAPGAGNLISGNGAYGVEIGSDGNVIQGNYIGTDASGTAAEGNGYGVALLGSDNLLGGTQPGAGNLISANYWTGVEIYGGSNRVEGNLIGTDRSGSGPLGNSNAGIYLGTGGHTVGGDSPEAGNIVAYNGGAGVIVSDMGNRILYNSVFANAGLGIDVGDDGVTPNDPGDGDSAQNYPELTAAVVYFSGLSTNMPANGTTISGMLNSKPDTMFTVQFFANREADPSGYGEGDRFIGTTEVTTDGSGNATFTVAVPTTVPAGQFVTATATDPSNNTSEFSQAVQVSIQLAPGEPYPVSNLNDGGQGSLRAAIEYANTNVGPDRVIFTVAGTINLQSPLIVNDASGGTIIDGTGAPGYAGRPVVVLAGFYPVGQTNMLHPLTNYTSYAGLLITSASNEVRGIQITSFPTGIEISGAGASANIVAGNYIGNDGSNPLGNGGGIVINNAPSNRIGTDADGLADEADRNVISGNQADGVVIQGSSATGNAVAGNFIGTDSTGTNPLGNSGAGVHIIGASGNTIGGVTASAGNTIAFNGEAGVVVESGVGNAVLGNAIFANGGLGIDLGRDGVTTNDPGDGDAGANELQNFPELTLAAMSGVNLVVEGTLSSAAHTNYLLQFYASTVANPSGYGEGERLLGSTSVTADASGLAAFRVVLPTVVPAGQFVTATATDPEMNTSEFSPALAVSVADSDSDGSADGIENGAPNGGDGNQDGMPDSQQANVSSLVSPVNADYVTMASPPETQLSDVVIAENPPPAQPPPPPEAQFPIGFVTFGVEGLPSAAATTVTLFVPPDVSYNTYLKYGPTPDNPNPHWYEFLFDGTTGAEILADRIVLHFVDGQRGDDDLTVNGHVSDPGGPALVGNKPPLLGPISAPLDPKLINTVVNVSATFTDVEAAQTHTALWSWGEGVTSAGIVTEHRGAGSVAGSHIYTAPGYYTVTLTVEDNMGAHGQATTIVMLVRTSPVFLHGIGADANPATLTLDGTAPIAVNSKYKDSPSVNFSGGNPWKEIGTWNAAPGFLVGSLSQLADLHVWLGLKNSDDIGTRFDLRAEVYKNNALVAAGEIYSIQEITRNPDLAKQVSPSFSSFSPVALNGTDVLKVKILTRIGTNGAGSFAGGHSSAVGLRLYFDAASRPSRFITTFSQ